jgi:hypothetical protein
MDQQVLRISALFMLLTFFVGGIVSPVLAHVTHPHELVASTPDSTSISESVSDACVLCDAAMPAVDLPSAADAHDADVQLLPDAAPDAFRDAAPDASSARGPPAA